MKTGRNDPCPCGSGKKHKQCCLRSATEAAPDELTWRRVRRAIDPLPKALGGVATRRFGQPGFEEARTEFFLGKEPGNSQDASLFDQLLFSFFFFDWLPDPAHTKLAESVREATIVQAYLAQARRPMDPIALRYLEACSAAPMTFYDVLEVRAGEGLRLRDMFLDTELDVIEKSASRFIERGDAIYAKVVQVEGIHVIECTGPVAIPPGHKPQIIALRKRIRGARRGTVALRGHDRELRGLYLSIADRLLNPQLPKLHNTDGDPMEPHTLIFDLDAPEAAAKALSDLTAGIVEPHFEYDRGKFVQAEISWARAGNKLHENWDNTTLGIIHIKGTRLTAEVNSRRRATTLRRLIERKLGDSAHVRPSVVRSIQAMLNDESTHDRRDPEQDELAALPEVQAMLTQHLREHYRTWLDSAIPALGGKTPRAAVRSRDGRETVAALIDQIERDGSHMTPPMDPTIVPELRESLGLKPRD